MTRRRGKLADITKGGQEALDDLVAPKLPAEGQPWFRGCVRPKATDHEVRDLPEPVLNAVYAGLIEINGPKGGGMRWTSRRLESAEMDDAENVAEYAVLDPWGDVHHVSKMSRAVLEKNIAAYAGRVKAEIAKGDEKAADFFSKRVAAIIHATLLQGEWTW